MTSKFAFYGRVSTEDQQDPAASKDWQLTRSRSLIEPAGGHVVAEFFDIGQSRSLPWKRRPESARLLEALSDRRRGFDAVVIGEPARAFYGHQFALTFPVFTHYDIELWVPEVGGRVDPGSDAHEMLMSLYGGMSKGERNRIKVRVRSAMAAQTAHEGRFLGGRPPYGYQLADAGQHPNPAKAADGKRLHRLEPDPIAAPVVGRIFEEYLAGHGWYAIAEGLTIDGIPSPSAHDPARNRHRQGSQGAWSKSAVRAIVQNPRYTGRQVWNRQRRDEVLLDVEDVAAGHETKMRWNSKGDWIWSAEVVHEPLIEPETYARAQEIAAAGAHRPTDAKQHRSGRRYLLSGLVRCQVCGRRMQGNAVRGSAFYRCRYPAEYARTAKLEHALSVQVREEAITAGLDAWLATLVDAEHIDATCKALATVAEVDDAAAARAEAARKKIADCDGRLASYRRALEGGAPGEVVGAWIAEVRGERLRAEQDLIHATPADPLTAAEIKGLVLALGDIIRRLQAASPDLKAQVYADLGVQVTYDPAARELNATLAPLAWARERVEGGT
jgi:site-specific DNA recombinase